MPFYSYCLDCNNHSYGWSDHPRCPTCGSINLVEADREEAESHRPKRQEDGGTRGETITVTLPGTDREFRYQIPQ